MTNLVMDREEARVITEYDRLFSILTGLLLPWTGKLFDLGSGLRHAREKKGAVGGAQQ